MSTIQHNSLHWKFEEIWLKLIFFFLKPMQKCRRYLKYFDYIYILYIYNHLLANHKRNIRSTYNLKSERYILYKYSSIIVELVNNYEYYQLWNIIIRIETECLHLCHLLLCQICRKLCINQKFERVFDHLNVIVPVVGKYMWYDSASGKLQLTQTI